MKFDYLLKVKEIKDFSTEELKKEILNSFLRIYEEVGKDAFIKEKNYTIINLLDNQLLLKTELLKEQAKLLKEVDKKNLKSLQEIQQKFSKLKAEFDFYIISYEDLNKIKLNLGKKEIDKLKEDLDKKEIDKLKEDLDLKLKFLELAEEHGSIKFSEFLSNYFDQDKINNTHIISQLPLIIKIFELQKNTLSEELGKPCKENASDKTSDIIPKGEDSSSVSLNKEENDKQMLSEMLSEMIKQRNELEKKDEQALLLIKMTKYRDGLMKKIEDLKSLGLLLTLEKIKNNDELKKLEALIEKFKEEKKETKETKETKGNSYKYLEKFFNPQSPPCNSPLISRNRKFPLGGGRSSSAP